MLICTTQLSREVTQNNADYFIGTCALFDAPVTGGVWHLVGRRNSAGSLPSNLQFLQAERN